MTQKFWKDFWRWVRKGFVLDVSEAVFVFISFYILSQFIDIATANPVMLLAIAVFMFAITGFLAEKVNVWINGRK